MNKDNAKDYLPLVQALAEGKTIQYYSPTTDKWHDEVAVGFNHRPCRYRIKPERIKKKMWHRPGSDKTALYPVSDSAFTHENWTKDGWKIVEVEFDAP